MRFLFGKPQLNSGCLGVLLKKYNCLNTDETQINCSNSELGLLFLNYRKAELKYWLPYKWPANKYSKEDVPFIRPFNQ